MSSAGVYPGCVVAVSGPQGADILAAALAAWRLDAIVMPCHRSPDSEIGWTAFHVGSDRTVQPPRSPSCAASTSLATTAALHLTSGSTGAPRAARRGVASILAEAEGYAKALSLTPVDSVLVPVPLAHSFGWGVAMSALLTGCAVDAEPLVRPTPVARKLAAGVATVVALTAPLALVLAEVPGKSANPALRHVLVGASPVSDDLDEAFSRRFGTTLTRGYGSTETGGTFVGERGIGRPVPGVEVVSPRPGESGELRLLLPAPVEGYFGAPEPPSRQWSTGDLVRHDHDGVVHFADRIRPALRHNGRFIDARYLEHALRGVPGVDAVYLLTLPSPTAPDSDTLCAMVAGAAVARADIETCLAGLPADVPVPHVVRCDDLPRDTVGKPDRARITTLVQERMTA
ncbi:fatty acid--CoA ligase family protein [Micromonosporaceae bacterium B7E4]